MVSSNSRSTETPSALLLNEELAALLQLVNWCFSVLDKNLIPKTMERNFCYGIYFCCAYICKYTEIQHPEWLKRELPNLRTAFRKYGKLITNHELALPFIAMLTEAEKAVQPQTVFMSTSISIFRVVVSFVGLGSEVAYDIVARNRQERSLELMRKQHAPTLLAAMFNLHNAFHQFVRDQNQLYDVLEHNASTIHEINQRTSTALFQLRSRRNNSSEEESLLERIRADENDVGEHVESHSVIYRIPSVPNLFQTTSNQELQNILSGTTAAPRK